MDKYQWQLDYEAALVNGHDETSAMAVADTLAVQRAGDAVDAAEYLLEDR